MKTNLLISFLSLLCLVSNAAPISSTAGGGAWGTPGTWVGGVVPAPTDDVIIVSGATVVLTTSQSCNSLTINGSGVLTLNTNARTLTIAANLILNGTSNIQGNNATRTVQVGGDFSVPASQNPTVQNITLTVSGSTTIDGTLTLTIGNSASKTFAGTFTISNTGTFVNTAANVPLTLGGSMVNNGTFNQGTGRVTFTGASASTITGNAAVTAFGGGITVNKGASQASILDVQAVITMQNGGLTLSNGTFKLSSASTITPFTSDPNMGATAQLWCNGGTMLSTNMTFSFKGAIQVTAGAVNIGTVADNFVSADGGSVTVSGGTLTISGELSDSAYGPPSSGLSFNLSGGVVTVATATGNTIDFPFSLDATYGSQFNMTGGTLVIQNFSNVAFYSTNAGFFNHAATSSFTGGTLQIGNASTAAGSIIEIDSGFPIHNLVVNNATASVVNQQIAVNDVTITAGTLNTNTFDLPVAGNWTNDGTYSHGTNTVTFNGASLQTIGGSTATSFYRLAFANTSASIPALRTNASITATNTLTMTSGIIDLNGNTFTLGQAATASTLSRAGSGTTNWMCGGTFKRFWLNATNITSNNGNFYGLFPMGASANGAYRPFEINSTAMPTAAGSYSVTHIDTPGVTDLTPVYNDGGTNIVRIDNSMFVGSISGVTGGTYNVNVTMSGLSSTGNLSDIRLAIYTGGTTASAVGIYAATTGTVANPTAKRTTVSVANLSSDFRVASTNSSITPLPITLVDFSAVASAQGVELRWATASEIDNDFFTVLRSSTGENFESVGTVKGHGTSNSPHANSLMDEDPFMGWNYYKLMQTDFDGKTTSSRVIAIQVTEVPPKVKIYPTPVNSLDELIIEIHGATPNVTMRVTIRDLQGAGVTEFSGATTSDGKLKIIYPVQLPCGLYVVEIAPGIYRKIVVKG
ncbi:MAG TPA: G8 domain-containing protein [Cyclobacteriaceae bacterium]|jgi:hypothetical protein|nr:G8 domain-containing protein [Cyclobacteriaceae bacterium]